MMKKVGKKLLVIIPAYNEEKMIGGVVRGVVKELKKWARDFRIFVVDDGSGDRTGELARKAGAIVVTHKMNRGLGAALGTGLMLARDRGVDVMVTFDGDGQHNPQDIKRVVEPVAKSEADFVVGSRFIDGKGLSFDEDATPGDASRFIEKRKSMQPPGLIASGMPMDRWLVNWAGNFVTWVFFGIWTTDSQSGLRALGKRVIEGLHIRTDRMEVSSEFFSEISRLKLRYKEVPIKPIYTEYSRKKGQEGRGNLNALSILSKLLLRLGR
jgi:glycosyltransferase involved in cell wall biosynthesis